MNKIFEYLFDINPEWDENLRPNIGDMVFFRIVDGNILYRIQSRVLSIENNMVSAEITGVFDWDGLGQIMPSVNINGELIGITRVEGMIVSANIMYIQEIISQ